MRAEDERLYRGLGVVGMLAFAGAWALFLYMGVREILRCLH